MENWAEITYLANRVAETAPIIPLACAWTRRGMIPKKVILIYSYVIAEMMFFILDVISRYILQNNIYVFHISTVVSVIILSMSYFRIINSRKWYGYIIKSIFAFLVIAFADAVFLNGIFDNLNSYAQAFGSVILVSIALMHIFQISRTSLNLLNQPEFFLSVSILIYFSYTIITYVVSNIIYSAGYDVATRIKLDRLISAPDAVLYAVHMGLLAWMFSFFPLSINPLQALPRWLHYSRWHHRPYKVLGHSSIALHHLTVA